MNSTPFYSNNSYLQNQRSHPKHTARPMKSSMNLTNDFKGFKLTDLSIQKSRPAPYYNRSNSLQSQDFSTQLNSTMSLPYSSFLKSNTTAQPFTSLNENSIMNTTSPEQDDGGVVLQISNLDQWYDEANMRHYLLSQLKPITPILSLIIESPSIAKVKVPSQQFAKQVVSHLHRKKVGHKRIFVSYIKDKTSAESSALRNKVTGLLRDVPYHHLPMCKFRELFQSRFKSSISILDLYRMPEICNITVNANEEKMISLQPELIKSIEGNLLIKANQHSAPFCIHHFKADQHKGWAEIEIDPLPNVFMTIGEVQAIIHPLLKSHRGDIPIASLLYCIESELNIKVQVNERGVSLEHLVCCVPNVQTKNNDFGIKVVAWNEAQTANDASNTSSSKFSFKSSLNSSPGDSVDTISKEVIELIKMCPKSTMMFSKFIPTYHNHFGKQCRVADYGCTKLIEMFEALASIVQILGDGESRQITLTHRTQVRRFTTDLFKILRSQPNKSIMLSKLSQAYLTTLNRVFDVTDYGVCEMEDLLDGLRNNNFIVVTKKRDENDDVCLFIQKRRQTVAEVEKSCIFAGEVVELLRNAPQYSIVFRKFVRSYHYYFGYQCRLSDYGFLRLADLFESLSGIVEMDSNNEDNRKIYFSRKVALRIFSEQIQEIIKSFTGNAKTMIKVEDLMKIHKNKYGYQMQGSSLGYDSVIDALKFVPFVELNSFDNELWIMSHLESDIFRQRSLLACLAIIDIGSSHKVPLVKFNAVFVDKFKFSLSEKVLYTMKHAVEVEMVNGVKMISITPMMKFLVHVAGALEHRKSANIHELKTTLKINVSSCFNYGYPNLSSLFQAFPDMFVASKAGTNIHERSDIELNRDSALSATGLKNILALKLVSAPDTSNNSFNNDFSQELKQSLSQSLVSQKIQRSFQNTPGQHWNNTVGSGFQDINNSTYNMHQRIQPPMDQYDPFYQNQINNRKDSFGAPHNNTMEYQNPTENANKFSMMNYQVQQQQQQQQQHKQVQPSYPQQRALNNESHGQSFYERNIMYQQQQMNLKHRDYNNMSLSSGANSSSSSFEASIQQPRQYDLLTPFYNLYEPPKPDTPPSSVLPPFWWDPVWGCSPNEVKHQPTPESLNINIPELKTFNMKIVSPFLSLSFNNKQMFTFDNTSSANSNTQHQQM